MEMSYLDLIHSFVSLVFTGWFTKAGEKSLSQAKKRFFIFNDETIEIEYYVKPGEKKAKGAISLKTAQKIVCEATAGCTHVPGAYSPPGCVGTFSKFTQVCHRRA